MNELKKTLTKGQLIGKGLFKVFICTKKRTKIFLYFRPKDWRLKKLTTFAFGQLPIISGHFLSKYITIFQKT